MANEITTYRPTGETLTARLVLGGAFVGSPISMTESGGIPGWYTASVPDATAAGTYGVLIYKADAVVASGDLVWPGASVGAGSGGVTTTTLEALRDKFRARLGMASQTLLAQDNLNSFLEDGQSQLWEQFDWPHLIKLGTITTAAADTEYDYPADCDPRRVLAQQVAVLDNTVYTGMREGIDFGHRSQSGLTGMPRRFERFASFEVWPKPDKAYTITFKYVRNLGRFSQDRDVCDIDPGLILLHALFNAKSHYRQPDAQVYANQLQARLAQIKAGAITKRSFSRGPEFDPQPLPRQV